MRDGRLRLLEPPVLLKLVAVPQFGHYAAFPMNAITQLEAPNGKWKGPGFWLTGWTSGDMRESKFMYIWAECSIPDVWPIEYRILRDGEEAVAWTEMTDSAAVFAKTGFVDEGGSPADTEPLGGAERLSAGTYALELRFTWNDHLYLLTGPRFEVASDDAERGGWMLGPR